MWLWLISQQPPTKDAPSLIAVLQNSTNLWESKSDRFPKDKFWFALGVIDQSSGIFSKAFTLNP